MESNSKGNVLLRRLFGKKKSREDLSDSRDSIQIDDLAGSSAELSDGESLLSQEGAGGGGGRAIAISPVQTSNTSVVMKDADDLLNYLKTLNIFTETVSAKQNRKWSEQETTLHQEAEKLETQYREVEATMRNIAVVKNQLKAVRKDQRNMQSTLDALQRQGIIVAGYVIAGYPLPIMCAPLPARKEAVMEAEIRKFEEGLLGQYRKSLFSGECKTAELEALQATVSHKRRALELLDELIARALTTPAADPNALSLKAVARRGARLPAARTEALRAHARGRRRDRDARSDRAAGIHGFSATTDAANDLPRPDTSIRTLFGDLFTQTGHEELEIIPLTYFETSV